MGCIIDQILNDQESDRQNSLPEDLNEILSEEIIKEGQTDPPKISADHKMIAIVDNEEIQKRKRHLEYRKILLIGIQGAFSSFEFLHCQQ